MPGISLPQGWPGLTCGKERQQDLHGIVAVTARSRLLGCVTAALVGERAQGALVPPRAPNAPSRLRGSSRAGTGLRWSLLVMQLQAHGALSLALEGKSPDCISSSEQRNVFMPRGCLEELLRAQ